MQLLLDVEVISYFLVSPTRLKEAEHIAHVCFVYGISVS